MFSLSFFPGQDLRALPPDGDHPALPHLRPRRLDPSDGRHPGHPPRRPNPHQRRGLRRLQVPEEPRVPQGRPEAALQGREDQGDREGHPDIPL